jgi:sugar lactone lactonase YvrE
MNEDKFIARLAIDRAGHLYTIENNDIFRYDLTTGEQLNQISFPDTAVVFSSVATTADNHIVAINRVRGQIIRFDPAGVPGLVIRVEDIADATGFEIATVDGSGNIYVLGIGEDVLGNRQDVVFKFNAEGQYITRFGQTGSEPGTFRAPNTIAVDGQGRVYVGDIFGIHIFNNSGVFVDFFEVEGAVFDIKINDQGELLVTNRTTVFKYAINVK